MKFYFILVAATLIIVVVAYTFNHINPILAIALAIIFIGLFIHHLIKIIL